MLKAHYIIFHPDKGRCKPIKVTASILDEVNCLKKWQGDIYADNYYTKGNNDPFVFSEPWLYSYCHATQLKRDERNECSLREGSILIFASVQKDVNNLLAIDTVFVIGSTEKWQKPIELPFKYKKYKNNVNSDLWIRHFFAPFDNDKENYKGIHKSVSFTYEAKEWSAESDCFSFLPLDSNGKRVTFFTETLPEKISCKIIKKTTGKYPVLLDENEINCVLNLIKTQAATKVIKDIRPLNNFAKLKSKSNC